MAFQFFILVAVIFAIGIADKSSAQSSLNQNQPRQTVPAFQKRTYYQPQNVHKDQIEFKIPPGISIANAEWVCKNPKTNDMMIIEPTDAPVQTGNVKENGCSTGYPQRPMYPQNQNERPTFPQSKPTGQPNQGTAINTNGEGIIDIRYGNNKKGV